MKQVSVSSSNLRRAIKGVAAGEGILQDPVNVEGCHMTLRKRREIKITQLNLTVATQLLNVWFGTPSILNVAFTKC